MPNIASLLKAEIARVSRKQIKSELDPLRKAAAQQRSAIAALKRQIADLHRQLRAAAKGRGPAPAPAERADEGRRVRFSAARLAAHRSKIGLSAADYGILVGASGLSVYKWESGKVRPRDAQLRALASVRGLSRRGAAVRLAQIKGAAARRKL